LDDGKVVLHEYREAVWSKIAYATPVLTGVRIVAHLAYSSPLSPPLPSGFEDD